MLQIIYLKNIPSLQNHYKKKDRIRESLKGHHLDDPEISLEFTYWFFANRFKYTPEQVDNLPYDRMVYFLELEKEYKKLEKLNT